MGSKEDRESLEIAIVGGGLGGICLAICLLHHNVKIHIYEAAPSFGEIGAGIMFGPHAVNALRLISPEALKAFQRCVTFNRDEDMKWCWPTFRYGTNSRNGDGKQTGDLLWQVLPDEHVKKRSELCGTRTMSSVHRARFLDEMVKLIPASTASYNKQLEKVEQDDQGVTLYFADGTIAQADAVIGCDGIKSKVRTSMMKAAGKVVEPAYAQGYVYRSLIDIDVAKRVMGDKMATNAGLWVGYGGYWITYPVEKGKLINVVAAIEDVGPVRPNLSYEQLVIPTSREKMYEDWKEWDPRLQGLLREFTSSDRWCLWHLLHEEKYYDRKICLAGDAAHAAVPHLGSGAGMAVEDAYVLGNLLASTTNVEQLEEAFSAYDNVRRPRTQKVVAKSKEAGVEQSLMLDNVGDDFAKLQAYTSQQYGWVWGLDLEGQLAEAKKLAGFTG